MLSTKLLAKQLSHDYPKFNFRTNDISSWDYDTKTINYLIDGPQILLLHELAHAVLNHKSYNHDIDLVKLESEAWAKAKELGIKYQIDVQDEEIQAYLDTYRDWLHRRSKCTQCGANGVQLSKNTYRCPICDTTWIVNQALQKQLRRYEIFRSK